MASNYSSGYPSTYYKSAAQAAPYTPSAYPPSAYPPSAYPQSSYGHYAPPPPRPPSPASSISSSSYAGSAVNSSPDMISFLHSRLSTTFSPLPLDRSIAIQAQTSGMMNATSRDLMVMREEANRKLASTARRMKEGLRVAREVKRDLEYIHGRVAVLGRRTRERYPEQYAAARERIGPHG